MSQGTSGENLINTWAQAQQKLLTNWLDTVKRYSGAQGPDLWKSTVDAWQTSVQQTLDAQEEWMRQWTKTLVNTQGTPGELQALAREGRDQLQRWIDTERELWQSWFKIVKDINFKVDTGMGAQPAGNLLQLWQETTQKMIETQAGLARQWMSGFTDTKSDK
jgi:hypothetical protein